MSEPEKFEALFQDVRDIKHAVIGDSYQRGLVNRMEAVEKRQSKSELKAAGVSGLTAGLVIAIKSMFGK